MILGLDIRDFCSIDVFDYLWDQIGHLGRSWGEHTARLRGLFGFFDFKSGQFCDVNLSLPYFALYGFLLVAEGQVQSLFLA